MKKGIHFLLLLTLALSFTNCQKHTDKIIYNKKYIKEIKAARKDMMFYVARNYIPGASIAIAKNGEIIYSEAMGLASKDLDVGVTRNTKYRIGELSELFTSVIYMKMIENGVLHPDSTVQHYFPNFPEKRYKITLRDLAYNCSGIHEENMEDSEDWEYHTSLQQGLKLFKNDTLLTPPGLFQSPSIYNYNLLGAIMEKVTKKSFNKILKEYLTDTLKLTNTVSDNPFRIIKGRTDYFDYNIVSNIIPAKSRDLRYSIPSRGILSNAEDLVKFGNAVFFSDYLSEKTKTEMLKQIPLYNNIPSKLTNGWLQIESNNGDKLIVRGGKITGGSASILIHPKEKIVIAYTTNLNVELNDTPAFDILDYFLPEKKNGEKQ
jgi:CubicO group peptidase (beta-lactamase class C family)